ncbi:MAG: GNAT family N-acetyltransferase [Pirellulales bacterium]
MSALSFAFWNFAAPPVDAAARWNELWNAAPDATPIGRWEHILNWLDHRSARKRATALVVEQEGRLVAALPLRTDRVCRFVPAWRAMAEAWAWAGDLLVDANTPDQDAIHDCLVRGLGTLRRPWVWFDAIALEETVWRDFVAACGRAGLATVERPHFECGRIAIHGADAAADWNGYETGRSRNQRQQIRKAQSSRGHLGGVVLETHRPSDPDAVASLLVRGFAVEDKSWKGPAGTSVLRTAGALEFYLDQAAQLAHDGELELTFLRHGDVNIAFEYGWRSKSVYYTPKIGYDEAFAHLSPSQLLRGLKLEELFADPTCYTLDFCGPLAEATAKWATSERLYSGLIVGIGLLGNTLLHAAETYGPGIRATLREIRDLLIRPKTTEPQTSQAAPASKTDAIANKTNSRNNEAVTTQVDDVHSPAALDAHRAGQGCMEAFSGIV